jgi:hypothetical protein
MVPDQLREPGGGGLLGGETGLAGFAVGAAALDLDGLVGAEEEQGSDGGDLDAADLGSAVAGSPGATLERGVLPG